MRNRSVLRIAVGAAALMPLAALADESLVLKFAGGAPDAQASSATTSGEGPIGGWAAYMPVAGLGYESFVWKFASDVPDAQATGAAKPGEGPIGGWEAYVPLSELAEDGFVSKFAGGDPDAQATSATKPGEGPIGGWEAYKAAARTYPADEIPPAVVQNAKATHQRIALADSETGDPGANGHQWRFYGPKLDAIQPGVTSFSGATNTTASRITAMVVAPDCSAERCRLWVGASGGGVWRTDNALAREHVKVVLTGEGSDELLAGYGKYPRVSWNWRAGSVYERLVPQALRGSIANGVVPNLPGRLGRLVKRSFLAMDRSPESMFFDNFASIRLADQWSLLAPGLRGAATRAQAYGPSRAYFEKPNGHSTLLDRLLYADIKTYLVELLMKQDQMSMATSIESRVPFLDHKLVEFAAQLPDEWKLNGFTTKRVLRESMKGLLPESILNRPKMGFPVPFAAWTRGSWNGVARDVLLDSRSRQRGIIDPMAVDRLLRDHAEGRTEGGDRIWSLLNLELWHRTFIDNEGIQTLPNAHSVVENRSVAAA